MKHEPIHSLIYKCPICNCWSENKSTIEECIKGHGDIPKFVKILLFEITKEELYPEPKLGLDFDDFVNLVKQGRWSNPSKRNELKNKLFAYETQITKQLNLVKKIQEEILHYEHSEE